MDLTEDEYLSTKYFIDYFNNTVRLGTIGKNRLYDDTDYIGMAKSNAMDIADDELLNINKNILLESNHFMEWFDKICKYSVLYHAIYVYLFNPTIDTSTMTLNWFREFYIDHTI
jgi:hypothetical protein